MYCLVLVHLYLAVLKCLVLPCLPLVVPKMLFRKHLCACFWHRLGLESCWDPLFRNHAPQRSTKPVSPISNHAVPKILCPSMHLISLFLLVSKMPFWHLVCDECHPLVLKFAVLHRLPSRPWTGFAIRRLVFALYSPGSFRRLDRRATCGASMGESTYNNTVSHAKLLAAVPDNMNFSVANIAVQWCLAIGACIFNLFDDLLRLLRRLSSSGAFFFNGCSFFCFLRCLIGPRTLSFCLPNFRTHILQDLGNLFLRHLAASSLQPSMRALSCMLYVYAYITLLSPVSSGPSLFFPAWKMRPQPPRFANIACPLSTFLARCADTLPRLLSLPLRPAELFFLQESLTEITFFLFFTCQAHPVKRTLRFLVLRWELPRPPPTATHRALPRLAILDMASNAFFAYSSVIVAFPLAYGIFIFAFSDRALRTRFFFQVRCPQCFPINFFSSPKSQQ